MRCWFRDRYYKWETGEVLGWTANITQLSEETLLTPIAIVRNADGYVDAMFAHDIELEEPEDYDAPV